MEPGAMHVPGTSCTSSATVGPVIDVRPVQRRLCQSKRWPMLSGSPGRSATGLFPVARPAASVTGDASSSPTEGGLGTSAGERWDDRQRGFATSGTPLAYWRLYTKLQ